MLWWLMINNAFCSTKWHWRSLAGKGICIICFPLISCADTVIHPHAVSQCQVQPKAVWTSPHIRGSKRRIRNLSHAQTTFVTFHYTDVIMGTMASQITSLTIVYWTIYSGADPIKHQSSASLAFVWRIHQGPVNSPHKWPVTRKMLPFDVVIMLNRVWNFKIPDIRSVL